VFYLKVVFLNISFNSNLCRSFKIRNDDICSFILAKDYLMYSRGPGFLASCKICLFPLPSPPPVSKMSLCVSPVELILKGGEGEVAKSYDGEKAWPSIILYLLSDLSVIILRGCKWAAADVSINTPRHVDRSTLHASYSKVGRENLTILRDFCYCAADFSLLNLPKGKSLGRSKPATSS
jgi:hypothetical protein